MDYHNIPTVTRFERIHVPCRTWADDRGPGLHGLAQRSGPVRGSSAIPLTVQLQDMVLACDGEGLGCAGGTAKNMTGQSTLYCAMLSLLDGQIDSPLGGARVTFSKCMKMKDRSEIWTCQVTHVLKHGSPDRRAIPIVTFRENPDKIYFYYNKTI